MKRNWILVVLTVLTVTLSGCFGIEEKVLIHKDGSGVFTYSIDCTQMITQMMEMVAKLDKAFASDSTSTKKAKEKDPEDAKQKMMEKVKEDFIFNKDGKMSSVKGLSSYREFADTTGGKWVIGVTFNFDKVATLNKALATMFAKKEKGKSSKQGFPPPTYSFKNGVLTRELTQAQVQELAGGDDDEDVEENFYSFPNSIFDEFDWPHWGTDSDWSLKAMNAGNS